MKGRFDSPPRPPRSDRVREIARRLDAAPVPAAPADPAPERIPVGGLPTYRLCMPDDAGDYTEAEWDEAFGAAYCSRWDAS